MGGCHPVACATDRCCHSGLNPMEGSNHSKRSRSWSPAFPWLRGQQSPALARLGQGSPAPAAVALRADLIPGGDAVLVLVCELVDLVCQLLHRARPEATAKAPQALEVVHTLAIALNSDAGGVRTAGEGKEGNMRPLLSRVSAARNRSIREPEGPENCYRLLNCHTPLTIPRARAVEGSTPCQPRDGTGHSYLAWVLREVPFTSCG